MSDEDDQLEQEASENKTKNILNKGKSKTANAVRKLFSLIFKRWSKWVALGIIIVVMFVAFFNEYEKVIFRNVVGHVKSILNTKDGENIDFATSDYIKIVKVNGKYCLKIDKDLQKNLEKKLEEDHIKPKDLNIDSFDCFMEFIKAEIVTQYPRLGLGVENTYKDLEGNIYTDGIIYIKRIEPKKKAKPKTLTYLPQQEYEELCENNDPKALDYFSLSGNRELLTASYVDIKTNITVSGDSSIVNVPEDNTSYEITEEVNDYLSLVKKYTMPFALQLAILQTSDSENMAVAFAKLAQDSTMTITIEDNTEITTYDQNIDAEQHITGQKKISYTITQVNTPKEGGQPYTTTLETGTATIDATYPPPKTANVKIHSVITTNTPKLELTYVDCWLAKIEKTYKLKESTENTSDGPNVETEEQDATCSTSDDDVVSYVSGRLNACAIVPVEGYTSYKTSSIQAVEGINLKLVTTTTDSSTTEVKTKEFVSTKSKVESNEEKIFEIFRENEKGYASLYDAQEWFYKLLEEEEQTVEFVDTFKYLIKKYKDSNYKGTLDLDAYDLEDFQQAGDGTTGVFGCNLSREEFIKKAKAYRKNDSTYQQYMAKYAGDFYDVCTKKKYNVNPCLAYAHACLETGNGSSSECHNIKNYFGMAHGNEASSGKAYSSVADSVEDYCKWVLDNATPGKSAYKYSAAVSKKYAKYNKNYSGDPATNPYDLYSRYAALGNIHYTADSDYTVLWGKGGRTYTRIIYGGYNYDSKKWKDQNKYKKECGNKHKNASDKTTVKEQADYAEYAMNKRLDIAIAIFGEGAMSTGGGDILSKAKEIHTYMEKNGYRYCLLGKENDTRHAGKGGSHGLNNTFEESKKGFHLTCCATYVSWVLDECGYTKVKGINGADKLGETLKKSYKCKIITKKSDLKPGDICFKPNHVQIYGESGIWYNAGSNNAIMNKPKAYVWNGWTYAVRILE